MKSVQKMKISTIAKIFALMALHWYLSLCRLELWVYFFIVLSNAFVYVALLAFFCGFHPVLWVGDSFSETLLTFKLDLYRSTEDVFWNVVRARSWGPVENQLNWSDWCMTLRLRVCMRTCEKGRRGPVTWMFFDIGSSWGEDRMTESLHFSVWKQLECRDGYISCVNDVADVLEELGRELRSLLGQQFSWLSIVEHPLVQKELGNFSGGH